MCSEYVSLKLVLPSEALWVVVAVWANLRHGGSFLPIDALRQNAIKFLFSILCDHSDHLLWDLCLIARNN